MANDDVGITAATARIESARAKSVEQWQERTLPFVRWGIGALAALVFGSVIFAAGAILPSILSGSDHVQPYSEVYLEALKAEDGRFEQARAQTALVGYRTARRHDRANAGLLTRELLRFGAFMIGAALVFVGALFTVGKFSDIHPTDAKLKGGTFESSLTTASPGIFSMAIGGAIVVTAIYAHYEIEVLDEAMSYDASPVMAAPPLVREQARARLCASDPTHPECES